MKRPTEMDPCREFDWLAELACPEREQVDEWSKLSEEQRSAIERLEAEIWGLLPCLMDPVAPSPSCRETLMRRLTAPSPVTALPKAEVTGPPTRRWMLPLAAGITLAFLGFAVWTLSTIRTQREQIVALRSVVQELGSGPASSSGLANAFAATREKLDLVSSRGVEICALRPTEANGADEAPYGLLFLAADHQHWYVRVAGLEPAPDRYYQVWFETEHGFVPAGNLTGEELELSSPTMPEGTRAVHVSLEREPAPSAPSEEIVLFGDDMIQVF